jgi:hypothetical protein
MDAVYILGGGSLWNNEEIKYSVRSLAKYMYDLRDVVIIGIDPGNLPGAWVIPFSDSQPHRSHNAYLKTKKACSLDFISDPFLLMNDDFFMTTHFFGSKFPNYILKNSRYAQNNLPSVPVHCPIRIDKQKYLALQIDLRSRGNFSPRADYISKHTLPVEEVEDKIIKPTGKFYDYARAVRGSPWFSVGNSTTTRPEFQRFLEVLYPESSIFEKPRA